MQDNISIFMPAYNEEESIRDSVAAVYAYAKNRFKDFEIIIVDDGSRDATARITEELKKNHPGLRLVRHEKNRGYAQAIRTGIAESRKDLIFYTDSDGQFDIRHLDLLLPLLAEYDIITGYRLNRQDPTMRIWMAKIYNLIYRMLFGLKVRDIDCAFKIFKRKVFENIRLIPDIRTGILNAEIYLKGTRKGFLLTELGIPHLPRRKGISSNEMLGREGKFFSVVKPHVYMDFLHDTILLWKDLRKK